MNPHFFTAPLYFTLVQGSGVKVHGSRFKVQGSRFKVQGSRGGFADFFRRWYSCIAALPEGADRAQAA